MKYQQFRTRRMLTLSKVFSVYTLLVIIDLKGKFSSGIEGALASTLNHNFNWKQLSEMILCNFFDVFKVYLSNINPETAEILKIRRL